MLSGTVRCLGLSCLFALPVIGSMAIMPLAQAQVPEEQMMEEAEDLTDPNNLRPLTTSDSLLSLKGGERLMMEASEAIDAEDYEVAGEKLQQARQIFNQLTNFYLQLGASFSGIDTSIADAQRSNAAVTGQMRDEATYKLALVHRAQNKPELAVPLLIQVIRSQNPTSELGGKSYQQLYELGFVDTPYSKSSTSSN